MEKEKDRKTRKVFTIAYGVILLFSFFNIYNKTFDKKVSVLGDNICYYVLGQSLANNDGYINAYSAEKTYHNQFPPGYPVIIGLVSKFFTDDVVTIKRINGFFLVLSLTILFLLIKKFTGNIHIAFLTVLYALFNFQLLYYSGIMMSEIPFLFFSLMCIYLYINLDFSKKIYKNWNFLLLSVLIVIAFYIKTLGIALFVSILFLILIKKYWAYAISLIGIFLALVLPWQIRSSNVGGGGYLSKMTLKNIYRPEEGGMELFDWFSRFFTNFERYISREIPSGLFFSMKVPSYQAAIAYSEWIIGIIILAIMIFGLVRMKKYRYLILTYIIANMGILLLWPEVWNGPRFLIALIPFFIFLFLFGILELLMIILEKSFKKINKPVVYIILSSFSLVTIGLYSGSAITEFEINKNNDYHPSYAAYFNIAKWAKINTPKKSIVCCRKPLLFYYFSDRKVTGFGSIKNQEEFIEMLINKKVNYVAFESLGFSTTVRYLYPVLTKYPGKFKLVRSINNPSTALFKFQPEFGYWGDWVELDVSKYKDSIVSSELKYAKEGMGTYLWENGDKYEGEWKSNYRNGYGKFFTNSTGDNYLEGNWRNDSLFGINFLMSKQGDTLEKRYYESDSLVELETYNSK